MKRRLPVTNLSSENNLPTFRLNVPVVIGVKVCSSRNVGKLFSKLKLVTDNLLFICVMCCKEVVSVGFMVYNNHPRPPAPSSNY